MRQRQIDPLLRGVGMLWAVFSLMVVGLGIRAIWTGYSATHAAKQIWGGIGFVVFGGIFAAIGLSMAFNKGAKGKAPAPDNNSGKRGSTPGLTPVVFCLLFSTAGLVLLSARLFPDVVEGIQIGDHRISPIGIIAVLCCLAFGIYSLWGVIQRRRKQRERAQEVAEAREQRRREKPPQKQKRKRS